MLYYTQKKIINKMYNTKASLDVFKIAVIFKYVRSVSMQHGLLDMFENTGCFTGRSSSDKYSCHQVHFRIEGRVINKAVHGTLEKKNPVKINQINREVKQRDHHANQLVSECPVQMVTYTSSIMRWRSILLIPYAAPNMCGNIGKPIKKTIK